jgi:hypothetical protein
MDNLIGSTNQGQPTPNQVNARIDPANLREVKCDNCEGLIFEQKCVVYSLSALVSPTGEDAIIPQPVLVCSKCGKVLDI